ncbi:hypothetical protein DV702_00510 [Sporosarcina sp. PTS2304]|uniref:protoglobin family protein n=1 Tax=Sporosarcina sp. PTS2304 TaxID=2283194 RepID=UPI000E0D8916|nr:protoglobin family protein [Sporosarcina sp. PTS2304]AXH98317.1 hypothetical protein DV702_00510 [Sporosarcina sp. PTS2304]
MMQLFKKRNEKVILKDVHDFNRIGQETGIILLDKFPNIKKQIRMINLTENDLAHLAFIYDDIKTVLPKMTDKFYQAMEIEPGLLKIIADHSSTERLRASLTTHIQSMFEGKIDEEYLEQRRTIATIHVHIGLESKWYIAAFEILYDEFFQFMEHIEMPKDQLFKTLRAFMKVLNLEQ